MKKLELTAAKKSKKDVNNIHIALKKLRLSIDKKELLAKEVGSTTIEAIKAFQKKNKIPTTGRLNKNTLKKINEELEHTYFARNKTRITKLHSNLERLGYKVDNKERNLRHIDTTTRRALRNFARKNGLSLAEGRITEALVIKLEEAAIKKRFTTKTQIGKLHKQLNAVNRIGKLNVTIDQRELMDKRLGQSTTNAIKEFQEKYNIPATGKLDAITLDRLNSVASSRGTSIKLMPRPAAQEVTYVSSRLRLNKVSTKVAELQKALSGLGYAVALKEYNTQTFGKTTLKAVQDFQKSRGLITDGHVDKKTADLLNRAVDRLNPLAKKTTTVTYRVKGSVRDELLNRLGNMVLKVYERKLDGTSAEPLVTKKNHTSGFFDFTYSPPLDPFTGKPKNNFHLEIHLFDEQDTLVEKQIAYNVAQIQWFNFNLADEPYMGTPFYYEMMSKLTKGLEGASLSDITETEENKQITLLSRETGVPKQTVMRMVLSELVSQDINHSEITPEVVFACVKQNFPPRLPGNLLEATLLWENINVLVEDTAAGLVFSSEEALSQIIDLAIGENLVSLSVKHGKENIMEAFKTLKNTFTLEKPILVGNGTLKALLDETSVNEDQYALISEAFITHNGTGSAFWEALEAESISANDLEDLKSTLDLAIVTKSFTPAITSIKTMIADSTNTAFSKTSDVAKFNVDEWVTHVKNTGSQVPANIPGDNQEDKIKNYAIAIERNASRLYPTISAVARIKQKGNHALTKIDEIEAFADEHQELNFKRTNLDKYIIDNSVDADDTLKKELKIVQRVYKNAVDSDSTAALMAESIHSAHQMYRMGKNRLIETLSEHGIVRGKANRIFENAQLRYAQVLARFSEFRYEFNKDIPKAIRHLKPDSKEIQDLIGEIPDLEVLFGSMDSCDCKHCQSLYGPAAYFTDILNFLDKHNSLVIGANSKPKKVQEVLLDRRPDLGKIKLNCTNTHTPMPFIDLVCEILENHIDPQQPDFEYQTTLDTDSLQAIPQYIRPHAYETLATANFPVNESFHLWHKEIRLNLEHFGIPRWELMEKFQNISDPNNLIPTATEIAAEYFEMSRHEVNIVTTAAPTNILLDNYWNLDTSVTSLSVETFLNRSKLTYNELLKLLSVGFVNGSGTSPMEIHRPATTCDLSLQTLENLTRERFDLIHRFIRLWRKTPWTMWELGLLIDNNEIGKKKINAETLIHLKGFHLLQKKLNQPLEVLLAFYGPIPVKKPPTEPEQLRIELPSPYEKFFLNRILANPTDVANPGSSPFEIASMDGSVPLDTDPVTGYSPIPQILSALSISREAYNHLEGLTSGTLTLDTLSILFRYSHLAKGLKMSVADLMRLLNVMGGINPFQSIEITWQFIKQLELVKESDFDFRELEYILTFNNDATIGLREETLIQYLEALRGIVERNRELIALLKLSDTQRTTITAFNTTSLTGVTRANALTAITGLKTTLTDVSDRFIQADFGVESLNYILAFEDSEAFSVVTLSEMIQLLQDQVTDLYNNGEKNTIGFIADAFGLGVEETGMILSNLNVPDESDTLIDVLTDEGLISRDTEGAYTEISEANFEHHFASIRFIHKITVLNNKISLSAKEWDWFMKHHTGIKSLDFNSIPGKSTMADASYTELMNLYRWYRFSRNYPEPEDISLPKILELASDSGSSKSEIIKSLAALTQWEEQDIIDLDAGFGLQHTATVLDYTKVETYLQLEAAIKIIKIIGSDVSAFFSWVLRDDLTLQKDIAEQTRYAIKSKYTYENWLDKITPIQNELRVAKRSALVAYHLDHSQRTQPAKVTVNGKRILNPLFWKDAGAMYKYFLIDVEMGPDQLTSRLKQAISSVQFFVQRCFLNLEQLFVQVGQEEKEDVSSDHSWRQWRWMKTYRIWEANRKVFFYPENWIEPELRDDKSPFFKELEEELMQGEMTHENAETAFLNYLHKVDEVANLTVCGLYHEYEDLNNDNELYEINKVHVLAKTKEDPSKYFYRRYDMNYNSWSAWEKIDVEITGDHAVPVVYNRKLHIFWLNFVEKPQKVRKNPAAKASNGPTDAPEPQKMLEIQLGWTVKKHNGWTPKSISKLKLIHPWERPTFSYHLKPFYKSFSNELWLDLYITTSEEFNNRRFYDPYWTFHEQDNAKDLKAKKFRKVTRVDYNETFSPWHSSSFIFDGKVKDVKMNALSGKYRLISLNEPTGMPLADTDSVTYVRTNFGEEGRQISKFGTFDEGPKLKLPTGLHYHNNHLRNNKRWNVDNDVYTLEGKKEVILLGGANKPFELIIDHQDIPFDTLNTNHPFFYQDPKRSLFIRPEWIKHFDEYGNTLPSTREYNISAFYHPYTTLFIRELNRSGIDGLLNRKIQVSPQIFPPKNTFSFQGDYAPNNTKVIVDENSRKDVVDFSFGGAYSIYNWELFFHAPMLIANRLTQNQRFEEAMRWYHYIFDPTNVESKKTPQRFWITKPFFKHNADDYFKQRIDTILNSEDDEYSDQIRDWKNNPFKPHLIARYRPVAYQKNVVMKYLDNLISWGDQLFRRDTLESINEAALLYMLAHDILGDRPEKIPNVEHEDLAFDEIEEMGPLSNPIVGVAIEDTVFPIKFVGTPGGTVPLPDLTTLYFGIPGNDFILKYWDTVEDRMFKIRNSMNIDGVKRSLALFAPPIDPALLVKAAASGVDLSTVLNDITTGTPHYRFRVMLQKAVEFCSDVKQLGDKLLSALEKRDAEALSLLRSEHEIQLLKGVKLIKEQQIDEAVETLGGLEQSKKLAEIKEEYYDSREYMNTEETISFVLNTASTVLDAAIAAGYVLSGGLKLIPDFIVGGSGFGGTPTANAKTGGKSFGDSAEDLVKTVSSIANALQKAAGLASTQGSYQRRMDDWKHQKNLASTEIEQIQFQINAAMIRQAIAERDLENQKDQIVNAEAVYDYMKSKYTNEQLYNWMVSQIATTYFQSYQLAYEMAKKAEKCYQHELGIENTSFIQFGYWDSLKKGLLSGDKLLQDLRRLDASYLDKNKRELEISKHISMAQIAPLSLMNLKHSGKCVLTLPEWLFDMDYPGHYMRRIKSISVSIPCVVGPYTSINCTMSLTKHEMRISPLLSGGQYEKQDADDDRFRTKYGAVSSVATSNGQKDSGVFELNFNDERYLPFEWTGLDSEWLINMPMENNHFDFSTISDVIIHINYTAREGGENLATAAKTHLDEMLAENAFRLFSLKQEFPNNWHTMLFPPEGQEQEFSVRLKAEHYPYFIRTRLHSMTIKKIYWYIETEATGDFMLATDIMDGNFDSATGQAVSASATLENIHELELDTSIASPPPTGVMRFKLGKPGTSDFESLDKDDVKNVFLIVELKE